jgi:hypothetical protein
MRVSRITVRQIGGTMSRFQQHLRSHFAGVRTQLLAGVAAAGAPHSGLAGGHRETLIRDYLSDVLPKRLEIGRGMVFGLGHRSREADVVIWDAANYPCVRLADHQLFFAESTRVVLEAKSRWSADEFADVLKKCRQVRGIMTVPAPNMADEIAMLQLDVYAMKHGRTHEGMVLAKPHIATAAFVFLGGQSFGPDSLKDEWIGDADDAWPDALILLEPGILVTKHYGADVGQDYLEFIEAGDDSLLLYTAALMALVSDRCVQVEDPTYLSSYVEETREEKPRKTLPFRLTRPPSGRTPIWAS